MFDVSMGNEWTDGRVGKGPSRGRRRGFSARDGRMQPRRPRARLMRLCSTQRHVRSRLDNSQKPGPARALTLHLASWSSMTSSPRRCLDDDRQKKNSALLDGIRPPWNASMDVPPFRPRAVAAATATATPVDVVAALRCCDKRSTHQLLGCKYDAVRGVRGSGVTTYDTWRCSWNVWRAGSLFSSVRHEYSIGVQYMVVIAATQRSGRPFRLGAPEPECHAEHSSPREEDAA